MKKPKIEDYTNAMDNLIALEKYCDWLEGERGAAVNIIVKRQQTIIDLKQQIKELKLMIEIAKCPNIGCADGSIAHGSNETGWEQEQCQFCYERNQALNQ